MTEDMRIVFDPLRAGHEMLFIEDHRGDATNTANDPVVLGFPNVLRAVFFLVSNVFYHCAELNNAPRLMYRVFIRI